MKGPPLGPLLPLLLILNTAPVNPESTASPPRATSSKVDVMPQRKVADKSKSSTSMFTERSIETTTSIYDRSGEKLLRPVRSDSERAPTPDPLFYELSTNKSMKILSQIFESVNNASVSPYIEADNLVLNRNDTQMSSLGSVDVVVPSISGSDFKGVENKWNASGGIFQVVNNQRNRSSYVQRLGRTDAPMLNYIFDTYSTLNKHHHRNDRFGGPKIETSGGKFSVDTDAEAQLDCRVSSLSDKLVSWVRRREDDRLELLTIGQQTYTADSRFEVDFRQPDNWRLVLNSAKPADSGIYECQISTHPPLITRLELLVNAPIVSIVEAGGRELRDKYYERNSTLKLACRIRHLAAHTPAVFWLHADRILNDDTLRGGVSVKTEAVDGGADSTLLVARLNSSDSGRYTCSVGTDLFAVVNVHVLNESLAELHQGASSKTKGPAIFILLLTTLMVTCMTEVIVISLLQVTQNLRSGDQSSTILAH